MTQVIFSFDTEDYTNPGADDAILRIANILTSLGVRGCFNIVGELALALEERGRRDVIDALSAHEIDFHSWRHSWHPNVVEYGDADDWYSGFYRFFNEERRASEAVKRIFRRDRLFAAIPPGNCIASQAPYVYHSLDIPVYSGSLFKGTQGKTIWYCNQLNLENNLYPDDILWGEGADAFLKRADAYKSYQRVVSCMHPNMSMMKVFWDFLNCNGENQVPFGKWNFPERHSEEEIDGFFQGFEKIVRYFRDTPGYQIVTYEDVYREERDKRHPLTLPRLFRLLEQVENRFFFAQEGGECFSLAELYEASIHFLSGGQGDFTPRGAWGPLEKPSGTAVPVLLKTQRVKEAAFENRVFDAVPKSLLIDGVEISSADFLRIARKCLLGEETVPVTPGCGEIDLTDYYRIADFRLRNSWMHSKDFTDQHTTERLRLQAWTIRE